MSLPITLDEFADTLDNLNNKNYGAYKSLAGVRVDIAPGIVLVIDKVQADPFAPPSLVHVEIADHALDGTEALAVEDLLARRLRDAFRGNRDLQVGHVGQEIIERTVANTRSDVWVLRFTVALPARGRRIMGYAANTLLTEVLPPLIDDVVDIPDTDWDNAADNLERQESIRAQLESKKLVAFVADGSILPREAGNRDTPAENAIPFCAPDELAVEIDGVRGMGIPEGVTVIVGGGYHGKSTLLRALQLGVYPHVAGDGREGVVTRPDAVALRAEDGRCITGVDISAFINGLPGGQDTTAFSTQNASGSTSQAANLIEALEVGTSALLIDEDTSATNFMMRDERMRALIKSEPITPLQDRVRDLPCSTVIVTGGSSAFLDEADTIIMMEEFVPSVVSWESEPRERGEFAVPAARSLKLENPEKRKPASPKGRALVRYGRDVINLGAAEQLNDPQQTVAIAHAIDLLEEKSLDEVMAMPLEEWSPYSHNPGLYARPRRHEVMVAVNRWRGLQVG